MADARETFDRLTDAVNDHDLEAAARCYSPEAVLVSPDGTFEGREQAVSSIRGFLEAFPDMRVTSWSKVTSGDVVADEWTFTGTNTGPIATPDGETIPATGKAVSMRGADVAVVEVGLITSHRLYWDQLELLTQLGLLPQSELTA
jgi:predicted ester cyclase